jgi:hypothetical protein
MPIIYHPEEERLMSKLFVRHRRHVGKGAGRPRFAIVASHGTDLRVYKTRLRRAELEKIADDLDAEIVYLPRGERAEEGAGRRRREPAES